MKLGKNGKELLELYKDKLGITYEEAMQIIEKNNTALSLLEDELALNFTGTNRILSALMSATILREFYDFKKLRPAEIKLIKEYYDIEIKDERSDN